MTKQPDKPFDLRLEAILADGDLYRHITTKYLQDKYSLSFSSAFYLARQLARYRETKLGASYD